MKNKRRLLVLLLLCLFLFGKNVYGDDSYVINKYHVDVIVNLDNSYDIKEQLMVNFNERKHGIIRNIPYNALVHRTDGTSDRKIASIKNIKVNNKKSITTDSYYKNIKIGDADKYVTGEQFYEISYKYDIGDDKNENFDEFYFNIIGTEWDTKIEYVTFKIEMPKDFDISLIGFSYGTYGETNIDDLSYEINDNIITGELKTILNEEEGLTIRIELEEGYYSKIKSDINILVILSFVLPVLFLLYAINAWFKYSKKEQVIDVVNFYPPENLNSIDLAYKYKGNLSEKDVVSLLIYLANKGFISIKEISKGKLFKKKSFELTKIKDYDLKNKEEKLFMDGLFKSKATVTEKDLEEKFYTTITSITSRVNSTKNKKMLFDLTYNNKKVVIVIFVILTMLIININPFIKYGTLGNKYIYGHIPIYKTVSNYALVMTILIAIFLFFKAKRNEYGNEILGQINGFKHFLENAEKDKLEELVEADPKYFYSILPFTYVLGISNTWIKKFESIVKEPPEWYKGPDMFDMYVFSSFMNNTYQSAQSSMVKRPPSDRSGGFSGGGGGFSGGGFSGGGSGGGGGSSW